MAEFRYLFADLLTKRVTLEVPCYGVSYGRELNKASDGTLSINLDRTDFTNQEVIDATVPGKAAVYFERDGSLLWGGILWSRTYQSQAKTLSFTMQTFESYFYKFVIEQTLTFTSRDQRNILCDLIIHCQQKEGSDIGVLVDPNYPFTNNVVRTVNFYNYDLWTYGKAFDYLAEYDDGLDWTIEVYYDENGDPARRVRVDNVLGSPREATGLVWEYPGNITNYYWPENASRGAISVIGAGAGDGTTKLLTKKTNSTLLNQGFPNYQEVYSNTDVSVKSTLDTQTANELNRLTIPITVPTIEADAAKEPYIGSWNLGDYAQISIEDPRFEAGINKYVRIIGYTASPPSSDGTETVNLVLEDQGDV